MVLATLDLSYAPVARKIAYFIIFGGVITCYIIVTIRPPIKDQGKVYNTPVNRLQMRPNQFDVKSTSTNQVDVKPTSSIYTFDGYVKQWKTCRQGSTDKICHLLPPEYIMSITPPVFMPNYKNPCWKISKDDQEGPKIKCLPYFFLIGAPKAGTTDLYERLSRHPQISGMVKKELHWFTRKRFESKNTKKFPQIPYFSNYTDMFSYAAQDIYDNSVVDGYHKKIVGDCSVSTLWDNSYAYKYRTIRNITYARTAKSIYHLNPNSKFIAIIRNPVERAYSDYLYFNTQYEKSQERFHQLATEVINFHKDCLQARSITECLAIKPREFNEVRLWIGIYYHYFQEYFESFPKEQFYIMKLEDYSPDVPAYLSQIFDFLELDPIDQDTLQFVMSLGPPVNKQTRTLGDMYPETRKMLEEFYRPYNDKLGEMLGENFNYNKVNR